MTAVLKWSPGSELVLVAAVIAIMLASDLNADETNMLANLFDAIGDNLALIATKKEQWNMDTK